MSNAPQNHLPTHCQNVHYYIDFQVLIILKELDHLYLIKLSRETK